MNTVLHTIKENLIKIFDDEIRTIKIGLEDSITAKSCPIIRIVPSVFNDDSVYKTLAFTIYVGVSKSSNDLEKDYDKLSNILKTITTNFTATEVLGGLLVVEDVIFDEDRLSNLKMLGIRMKLQNFRD